MSQPKSWDVYDEYFYIHSIETPVTLKCIVITHQGVVHEGLTVFNFMGKSNYSRDLNIFGRLTHLHQENDTFYRSHSRTHI